ncbi:MAG: LPXTG cell wall anchor domain-containing protein, partial [Clostridium celatum]|nr:LPXTG cell wall anchor domain-containing protein [Clostridium celatum]
IVDYAIIGFLCGVSIVLMMNVSNQKDQIKIINNKLNKIINHLGIEDEELNKVNDELNELIEKAEGLKAEDYTEESFGNLNKILEEARSLVGVANSQEEINSMANKLKDAINNLESKENVDEKVPNPSEKPEDSTKPGNGNSNNSGMLPQTGIESGPWGIIAIVSIILGAMLIYRRSNKIIE